ncbi:MAG: tryptophan synthase subunit alpha [Candidatus Acidiferrales bacterium]
MSEPAISKPATAHSPGQRPAGRIARRFRELSEAGELGVVAYITAGDPSLDVSEKIILAAAAAGADVIELGVPFSDPVADGPTIQRASERALRAGTTLAGVIGLVRRLRVHTEVPLILFSYFNPILQMGLEKFADAAASAGADGVLATDLTLEESSDYRRILHARNLDTIFLGAPTSTDARLKQIAEATSGFLYLISRTGVTGEREALPEELPALVRRARGFTSLPIAVGFGISLPTHVTVLGGIADAAVVGSALMAEIEKSPTADAAPAAVAERIGILKRAAREGVSRRNPNPGAAEK